MHSEVLNVDMAKKINTTLIIVSITKQTLGAGN